MPALYKTSFVAEGPSDWLVLEEAIRALHPDAKFERLRPDMTQVNQAAYGGGWRGVRAWCQENGPRLLTLMGACLDAVRTACPEADRFCNEVEVCWIMES